MGYDRVLIRPDTAANWSSNNPLLVKGEMAIETDTGLIKVGNGSDLYNNLPYHSPAIIDEETITDATDITITLPDVTKEMDTRMYFRTGSGTGKVLFNTTSAQLINGIAASNWYLENEESIILKPGSTEWKVLAYGGYDQSGNLILKPASGGRIITEGKLDANIFDTIISTATNTVTISGLDINTDGFYEIITNIKNDSTGYAQYELYINTGSTYTDYYYQYNQADGANNVTSGRGNNNFIGGTGAGTGAMHHIILTLDPNSHANALVTNMRDSGSSLILVYWAVSKTTTDSNITSITLQSNQTTGFGVGSRIIVRRGLL